MAQSNKLGAFGGVFTPSILTILGVIMFLRLPWIVGQAGLWLTVGIVLLAHLVSVTSGLSVSSVATDKKVKAGGTYYIISRSLGLPIGGTLGIALFVGLSFSVSLYLIGFAESFLGFWEFETTPTNIRITGTVALTLVTTLTFISTSLAIKTQYFIMSAIALALISVLLGNNDPAPAAPHLGPAENIPPFIVLFAIFFPAVTGFEAGVSMSGDLKDPKKSLPFGTIAAIVVGLVVYLGLATFFAYRVSPEALVNNPNILLDLSFFAPIVVAGIWGATISSAIGSILGAPRILQATSADGITPRPFARGYGRTNEPRNAVLLAFVLAEAGILIGELNVIARIVSMFFITTYGFLNLTCSLESWASTDFRPSFRIPTWVSVVGALTCFVIMIQLDILATLVATLLLAGIYTYLKRQELRLDSGDTWEGVWSSLTRSALQRLNKVMSHSRNWRPNIILFSGGTHARPHLIEFGQWLVRKRGILSNFDLVEQATPDVLFPKLHQTVRDDDGEDIPGVFSRRLECENIYESMETVAQVYGFAGLDPNAVMLGWARHSKDPHRFGLLLHRLTKLDYNLLLLDYDAERGFGTKERIDIWWGGANNNLTLSLAMLKCLLMTEEWSDTSVRLLTVISDSSQANRIHRSMNQVLEEQRIDGTVKVINNAVEKRPVESIIKLESREADLLILGMPNVDKHNAEDFVANTNAYLEGVGSVLLVHASSSFENLNIGLDERHSDTGKTAAAETTRVADVEFTPGSDIIEPQPGRERALMTVSRLRTDAEKVIGAWLTSVGECRNINTEIVESLSTLVDRNFDTLRKNLPNDDGPRARRRVARARSDVLFHSQRLLERYQTELLPEQHRTLEEGLQQLFRDLETVLSGTPEEVMVAFEKADAQPGPEDSMRLRVRKSYERIRSHLLKQPISVRAHLQSLARIRLQTNLRQDLYDDLTSYGVHQYQFVSDVQKYLHGVQDSLGTIEQRLDKDAAVSRLETEFRKTGEVLDAIEKNIQEQHHRCCQDLLDDAGNVIHGVYDELTRLDVNRRIRKQYGTARRARELQEQTLELPALWSHNQSLVINFALIDSSLMAFDNRLRTISQKFRTELRIDIENNVLDPLAGLEGHLRSLEANPESSQSGTDFGGIADKALDSQERLSELIRDIEAAIGEIPETIEIISEESFQTLDQNPYDEQQTLRVSLRRLIDYLTETELTDPLEEQLTALPLRAGKALSAARDVSRLLSLNLTEGTADGDNLFQEDVASRSANVETALRRLKEERTEIDEAAREIDRLIDTQLTSLSGKLNPYLVSRLAANLGHYIRSEESRKMLFGVVASGKRARARIAKLMVNLLYRRSEGVLAARKLSETRAPRRSGVDSMLTLVEALSPRPAVLKALPSYYRHLFLGEQQIGAEFLVPPRSELEEAERTIRRYREGYGGGLLVLAQPGGGKQTMCRSIVHKHMPRNRVVHLFPPPGGSIDPALFHARLREAVRSTDPGGSGDLSDGSVVIINELEQWWERSPAGMAIVDEIVELINRESRRCFFIVNSVTESFRFINKLRPIDDAFLGIIECKPYDAEDLQRAILLRHRPSGLRFELDGQDEDQLSDLKLARLFNSYFDFSAGSVGVALGSWIAHIDKVEKDRLLIRTPTVPNLDALDQPAEDWSAWLQAFVAHRRLTPERLARLFRTGVSNIQRDLAVFRRTGVVTERSPGVLEINPYLEPFVIRRLSNSDQP